MESEARQLWESKRAYDAGKIITKSIPTRSQPEWAARILRLVLKETEICHPVIDQVQAIADDKLRWPEGHDAFSSLRDVVLMIERDKRSEVKFDHELQSVLLISELVAKVTYNATEPIDEFDDDSAAWLVALLRDFVDSHGDNPKLAIDAWKAISIHNPTQ